MEDKLTRPRGVLVAVFDRFIDRAEDINIGLDEESIHETVESLIAWDGQVRSLLNSSFTGPEPSRYYPSPPDADRLLSNDTYKSEMRIRKDLRHRIAELTSIAEMLDLYEEPSVNILAGKEHPSPKSSTTVFIVHGRSEAPKQNVARFLETATNAEAIILHEQAKRGRAIIETLEEFAARAAFAVVLLTADDVGSLIGADSSQLRARQNVVFELGLFIGALGRSRVAVLYEDGIELPSDMNGILYTLLDSRGAWQIGLGRELRAAGFAVDLNRAK